MPFNDGMMPIGAVGAGFPMSSPMTSPLGIPQMTPGQGSMGDNFQASPGEEGEDGNSQQSALMEMLQLLMVELQIAMMRAQQGDPQAQQEVQQLEQMLQGMLGGGQNGGGSPASGGGGSPLPFADPSSLGGGGGGGSAPAQDGGGGGGGSAPSSGGGSASPSGSSSGANSSGPAPNVSNVSAGGPINNPTDFANSLLKNLGAPTTAANVKSIVNWEAKEGGNWNNSAHYNPLNTTESMPGDSSMNSVGVKAYTSWDQGLQATVKTLEGGQYNDIVGALKSGQGLGSGSYKGLSTWSGGGYSSI